jgi:hypothetical protein
MAPRVDQLRTAECLGGDQDRRGDCRAWLVRTFSQTWPPVVPENPIRAGSRDEGESEHHPT